MWVNRYFPFALFVLFFVLTGCKVPDATVENTTVIEGKLVAVTTCCDGGDVQFRIEGYENFFYLNRAIEAGFDLEAFEAEVAIGDTVYIRAFNQFLPDEPGKGNLLGNIPSAAIATEDKIYYSTMPATP